MGEDGHQAAAAGGRIRPGCSSSVSCLRDSSAPRPARRSGGPRRDCPHVGSAAPHRRRADLRGHPRPRRQRRRGAGGGRRLRPQRTFGSRGCARVSGPGRTGPHRDRLRGLRPGFHEQPYVVDGASRVLSDVFGEAGRHTRSAVGVAALPAAGRSRSKCAWPSARNPRHRPAGERPTGGRPRRCARRARCRHPRGVGGPAPSASHPGGLARCHPGRTGRARAVLAGGQPGHPRGRGHRSARARPGRRRGRRARPRLLGEVSPPAPRPGSWPGWSSTAACATWPPSRPTASPSSRPRWPWGATKSFRGSAGAAIVVAGSAWPPATGWSAMPTGW